MGINVFTASGRCGQDMEVRFTPNGKAIGQFSLPVETGYGDSKKTSWVTCKMFGERAEKLAQYITKGAAVTVTGAFKLDEWEKDGVKHSAHASWLTTFSCHRCSKASKQRNLSPSSNASSQRSNSARSKAATPRQAASRCRRNTMSHR